GFWLRASGSCEWTELIRFTYVDGELKAQGVLSDAMTAMLRGGRRAAVEVGAAKDLYEISGGEFRGRVAGGAAAGVQVVLPAGPYISVRAMTADRPEERPPLRVTKLRLTGDRFW